MARGGWARLIMAAVRSMFAHLNGHRDTRLNISRRPDGERDNKKQMNI